MRTVVTLLPAVRAGRPLAKSGQAGYTVPARAGNPRLRAWPAEAAGRRGFKLPAKQPGSFQRHTTLSKRRSYKIERRSCDAEQESPLRARLGGPCRSDSPAWTRTHYTESRAPLSSTLNVELSR